jgi:uncharacterized membrane protein
MWGTKSSCHLSEAIFAFGVLIVVGHNAHDFVEAETGFIGNFWWDIFHTGAFKFYPISGDHGALLRGFPFVPWTGLMLLGYCVGKLFENDISGEQRTRKLRMGGIVLLLFFIAVRSTNL